MFESDCKRIFDCMNTLKNYYSEDLALRKQNYVARLGIALDLGIEAFVKYLPGAKEIPINYNSMVKIIIDTEENNHKWVVKENNQETMKNKDEFIQYCWEKNVSIYNLFSPIFSPIYDYFERKKSNFESVKSNYISKIKHIIEATKDLETFLEYEIDPIVYKDIS